MTALVELTTDIAAPIDVVYDLARDLDLHARSVTHTGERAIAGRTTGRIDAGEMVTWRARHFGLWWMLTSRITVADRPTRFADEQVSGPFAWFRHEHRFKALDDGGTRMLDRWEHRSPFRPIGTVVDRLVLGRYMRRLLQQRNRVVRAEAERAWHRCAGPEPAAHPAQARHAIVRRVDDRSGYKPLKQRAPRRASAKGAG